MSIALPAIWTPRRGRWWRLPRLTEFFSTGHLQYAAGSGHLLKNASSGHLANDCVPCAAVSCSHCGPCTPIVWNVSLTGVNISSGCCGFIGSTSTNINESSLAGTFCCTQTTSCEWRYLETPGSTLTGNNYAATNCTGTPLTAIFGVVVAVNPDTSITVAATMGGSALFQFVSATGQDCSSTVSGSNQYSAYDCIPFGSRVQGKDGSCSATPASSC